MPVIKNWFVLKNTDQVWQTKKCLSQFVQNKRGMSNGGVREVVECNQDVNRIQC